MTQFWQPSNPPSHTARDDGTFYGCHRNGDLSGNLARVAKPAEPLPDRVDHTTPAEIRNAFIERFWSEDGPSVTAP